MGNYKHSWPVNKEQAAHMRMRKKQNMVRSRFNKNEDWMEEYLKTTPYKWSRQSCWGFRVFDFWCHEIGVAVEVDGIEHNHAYDQARDKKDFERSGIIVLRVRNRNNEDAKKALQEINQAEIWSIRRIKIGLKPLIRQIKEMQIHGYNFPLAIA